MKDVLFTAPRRGKAEPGDSNVNVCVFTFMW